MTKTDEVSLLDKVIKRFGSDSYLGPWLAENRTQIVADIANDLTLEEVVLPGEARRLACSIVEAAKAEANDIVTRARETAAKERDQAREWIRSVREDAKRSLERFAGLL